MQPDNGWVPAVDHHRAAADITGVWAEGPREGGTDTDLPAMFLKYEKDSGSHHKGLTQQYTGPAPLSPVLFLELEKKSLQAEKMTKRLQGAGKRGLSKPLCNTPHKKSLVNDTTLPYLCLDISG